MSFDKEFKALCEKYDVHFEIIVDRNKVIFHPHNIPPDSGVTLVENPDSDFLEKAADKMVNYRGEKIV